MTSGGFNRPGYRAFGGLGPGSRIAGFVLEERVGAGATAVVFRARDEALGRPVAVKVIAPAVTGHDVFRARFLRESRAAAAVDSPYILPVYGAGEADGLLYLAMRFVAGGDLAGLVQHEGGQLAPDLALALITQVAAALDAAHAAGLVHRDVKPQNILIDDGRPGRPVHAYLADFGLSKEEQSTPLTVAGQFLGTPGYSAPEQIMGEHTDGRADQYALGCMAFGLLTGSLPFQEGDSMATLFAHLEDPVPAVTALQPQLPAAVDVVVARALAKSPDDRHPTCGQFAAALRDALASTRPTPGPTGSWSARETVKQQDGPTRPQAGSAPPTHRRTRQPRPLRARTVFVGAATALAVAAAGILYVVWPSGTAPGGHTAPGAVLAATLTVPDGGAVAAAWFSADGKYLAASPVEGAKIYLWNTVTDRYLRTVTVPDVALSKSDHRPPVIVNVAFSSDDAALTAVTVPHTSNGDPGPYPDQYILDDRPIVVSRWNLASGDRATEAAYPADYAATIRFSGDNSTAVIAGPAPNPAVTDVVSLAPGATGKPERTLPVSGLPVGTDDSGSRVAINYTTVWDTAQGKKIAQFNYGMATNMLSPDGATMYVTNSGGATLWAIGKKPGLTPASATPADPRWGQQLVNGNVTGAYSTDGSVIATQRPGGELDLWNTATSRYLLTITDQNLRAGDGYPMIGPGGSEAVVLTSAAPAAFGDLEYHRLRVWKTSLSVSRLTAEA